MGAHLELLARILVHMGALDDGEQVTLRRQRDGTGHLGTRLLSGIDDELRGLVHDLMIVSLEADANLLISHFHFLR